MEKQIVNGKVCRRGLEDIWIVGKEGRVKMCSWTNYYIGNLTEKTIEELWHSEEAQVFRNSLLDGSYRYCNAAKCPHRANKQLEELKVEYYVPEYPKSCNLSYQRQCNYVCKFCRGHAYEPGLEEADNYQKIEAEVFKMMPHLNRLTTNGEGELFCSGSIMKLLAESKFKPELTIGIETNGSLFTPANWEKIKQIGEHNLSVSVTVHSFQEDVYQYLSGTRLPLQNIIDNLHFMSKLRQQNIINRLNIATVICEMNYREMPAFVKKCLEEFEPDRIRLRFFEPCSVMDKAVEWFYDVRNPYHPYYSEFVKVMKDPIFNNEKVWKWQGNELSLQRENPYILEHKNFMLLADLVIMEDAELRIKEWHKNINSPKVALYGASKGGMAYLRILKSYGMDIRVIFDKYQCETEDEDLTIMHPTLDNVNNYDLIIITQEVHYRAMKEELDRMMFGGTILSMSEFISQLKGIGVVV